MKKEYVIKMFQRYFVIPPTQFEDAVYLDLKRQIERVLETLPFRSSDIIKMRFGLNDYKGTEMSLSKIGYKWGISVERVRQIIEKTIKKLRHHSKSSRLWVFYSEEKFTRYGKE